MVAVVVGLAIVGLAWILVKDIAQPPLLILSVEQLLELFGLFMLVVIGIELWETIMKTYLTQGQPHFEVVLSMAIIAIARKVIVLDPKDVESLTSMGIASIVLALTGGYFLMKTCQARDCQIRDLDD
jgi:uncharacterized membrane protein (DUF373 family)